MSQDESSLSSDGGERFFVYPVGRHNVKQRCGLRKCWYKMADSHWPDLLEQFGFPVTNGFISILNPITLRMDLGEVDKEIVSLKHVVTSYLSSLFKEPNFYGILGALTTFFLFVCVSWIHGWKVLKYPMPLRGKDKDKKRPKSAATITLKENTVKAAIKQSLLLILIILHLNRKLLDLYVYLYQLLHHNGICACCLYTLYM